MLIEIKTFYLRLTLIFRYIREVNMGWSFLKKSHSQFTIIRSNEFVKYERL